jgi:hypothetical protein
MIVEGREGDLPAGERSAGHLTEAMFEELTRVGDAA